MNAKTIALSSAMAFALLAQNVSAESKADRDREALANDYFASQHDLEAKSDVDHGHQGDSQTSTFKGIERQPGESASAFKNRIFGS